MDAVLYLRVLDPYRVSLIHCLADLLCYWYCFCLGYKQVVNNLKTLSDVLVYAFCYKLIKDGKRVACLL